jgi:hypothetical protein
MSASVRSRTPRVNCRVIGIVIGIAAAACSEGESQRAIVANELLTLGRPASHPDLAARVPSISSSWFVAAQTLHVPSGGVAVFDSTGTHVKSISRSGRGPGELSRVTAFGFGSGDTLWIVDGFVRAHAYSPPPALTFVRSVQFESPFVGEVTPYGFLDAPKVWYGRVVPPRLLAWDGRVKAEFGTPESLGIATSKLGAVQVGDSTSVWRASGDSYAVDRLSNDRTVSIHIARNVDWFPPGLKSEGPSWMVKPRPRIDAISTDAKGNLWLLIHRAAAGWQRADGLQHKTGPIAVAQLPSEVDASRFRESAIDVIDPSSGILIGELVLDGSVIGFASGSVICRIGETEDGRTTLTLLSLSLGVPASKPRQETSKQPRALTPRQ